MSHNITQFLFYLATHTFQLSFRTKTKHWTHRNPWL